MASKLVFSVLATLGWLAVSVRLQIEEDMNGLETAVHAVGDSSREVNRKSEWWRKIFGWGRPKKSKPNDSDYWTTELGRCKRAKTGRFMKRVVGIPVGAVVAGSVMVASGTIGMDTLFNHFSYSRVSRFGRWTAYWGVTAVIPVAMIQSQNIANFAVENVPGILGADGHRPACCCKDGSCALMGSSHSKGQAEISNCPDQWEHDATQCVAPEALMYKQETVSGCVCKQGVSACDGNEWYRGHAWCEVEGEHCGFKRKGWKRLQWDYCRFADSVTLQDGSVVDNSALSAFVPNLAAPMHLSSSNPWTLGSFVDGDKGVAVARPERAHSPQCFAGAPVETLSGCAIKCLQEGAPNAKTKEGEQETGHLCKALSYNRQNRLCVSLPSFASDAVFTEYSKNLYSEGWQNLRLDE